MDIIKLRTGETTDITFELTPALGEDEKLKVGLYAPSGTALYETYYPDEDKLVKEDDTHFTLNLGYTLTRKLTGPTMLRCVVFNSDKSEVNAGDMPVTIVWEAEPATKEIKY